jgi:membrane glycosyltransferase
VITSRTGLGLAARRRQLFLIPEEYAPPTELANTDLYQQQNQANALREGFLVAVVDPLYNALVCAMARARHAKVVPAADHLREQRLAEVLAAGPSGEKAEAARWRLLNDPDGMALLHQYAWDDPAGATWLARYRKQYPHGVSRGELTEPR